MFNYYVFLVNKCEAAPDLFKINLRTKNQTGLKKTAEFQILLKSF